MRNIFLILCIIISGVANPQDSLWKKIAIDSNLTFELPGFIEKAPPMTIDIYSYEGFNSMLDSSVFSVMVCKIREEPEIYSTNDYLRALNKMAEGVLDAATERKWTTRLSNVAFGEVPGKKIEYSGIFAGRDATGIQYCFIINGLAYIANAVFLKNSLSAKDSADLNHFTSSFRFTDDFQEMRFINRSEPAGNGMGKLFGLIIMIVIIVGVVIFVIKSL